MYRTLFRCTAVVAAAGAGGAYFIQKNHSRSSVSRDVVYFYDPSKMPKREDMLKRLKEEEFDVIVVGGGASGAGVALDAASRGLNCAMLEYEDFAAGTSSRSTKLIHGGVRYLEQAFKTFDVGQLKLVIEALEERSHMLQAAPYLSQPLPILMPVYKAWQVPYFWVGIKSYDWLAKIATSFDTAVPECFYVSRANSLNLFPLLNPKNLKGSLLYYDGQQNDARMNLHLALTSAAPHYLGSDDSGFKAAAIANHCEVSDIIKDPRTGRLIGVRVFDKLSKESFDVHGTAIINCAGPYADEIRKMADPKAPSLLSPAAGVHIVLPKLYCPPSVGMIIPETSDGRVLFYLPWENNTLAGTTDSSSTLTRLPQPTSEEVEFILRESARYLSLPEDLIRKDIKAAWSGLRPLVFNPKSMKPGSTAKLSRSHEIHTDPNGLISVLGGKWTTYRRMAEEAVDRAVAESKLTQAGPCRTRNLKLIGCVDSTGKYNAAEAATKGGKLPIYLSRDYNIPIPQAEHLAHNYGFRAFDLLKMTREEPHGEHLLDPIVAGHPFIKAEILFAIRHEMARTAADILGRRIPLAFLDATAAQSALPMVVETLGRELNWDNATKTVATAEGTEYLNSMQYKPPASSHTTEPSTGVVAAS